VTKTVLKTDAKEDECMVSFNRVQAQDVLSLFLNLGHEKLLGQRSNVSAQDLDLCFQLELLLESLVR